MKRAKNLYAKLISDDNLRQALQEVNRTHRWHPHHKPNRVVAWVEGDMEQRILDLREIIETGFEASPAAKKRRWDKSAGKWRDIHEPKLWPDQYIHHALVQVLQPVMMRGMDPWCCGSIRGRGIHYGLDAMKKWNRKDPKGTRWCAELLAAFTAYAVDVVKKLKDMLTTVTPGAKDMETEKTDDTETEGGGEHEQQQPGDVHPDQPEQNEPAQE